MKHAISLFIMIAICLTSVQAAQVAKWSFENNLSDTASGGTATDTLVGIATYPGNGYYPTATNERDPNYSASGISGYAVYVGAMPTNSLGAMYISSAGDSVDLSLATGVFTMEGFFKPSVIDSKYARLFSKWVTGLSGGDFGTTGDLGYHFAIYTPTAGTDTRLDFLYRNSADTAHAQVYYGSIASYPMNTWYHFAITGDGTTMKLYINGVLMNSASQSSYTNDSTAPFWIGGRTDAASYWNDSTAFKGLVDEVIVWNEVKDATYLLTRAALAATANQSDKQAKIVSPLNESTSVTPEGTALSWTSTATSPTYNVYMGTDSASLISVATGLSTASYSTGVLPQNTTYYWRVDVVEGSTTYTGDVWNFTTSNAILTSTPDYNSISQNPAGILLSWTSIGTAPTYDVYFGTDESSLSLVSNDQSEPNYSTGALSVVTKYYWRVDVTSGSNSFTGSVSKFTSGGKVTASYPGNNGWNVDNDATFTWKGETLLATAYNVYFGTSQSAVASATTASSQYVGTFTDQSWQVTPSMTYDANYYWRVDEILNGAAISGDVKGFKCRSAPVVKLYWPLDGDATDSTANGNDGIESGVSWQTGLFGQCVNITSASSDVICYGATGLPYDINDCWSMNMFISTADYASLGLIGGFGSTASIDRYAASNAQARYFMFYDIDDSLRTEHDGVSHCYFWTGRGWLDVEANKNYTLNEWNMLTATYDAYYKTLKMYLNGELVASRQYYPYLTTIASDYQDVMLAPTSIWTTGGNFTGLIDEFKIYYSTLNAGEVQDLVPWAHNPTPADDANAVSLNPTLTWEGNAAATSYTLKYGTSIDTNGDIVSPTTVSGLTTASYVLSNLGEATTYYWTVDSVVTGYGSVSVPEVWNFTTGGVCLEQPDSDLNDDCIVNFEDLEIMVGEWLDDNGTGCTEYADSDLNSDCKVNFIDFNTMANEWLKCGLDLLELCD